MLCHRQHELLLGSGGGQANLRERGESVVSKSGQVVAAREGGPSPLAQPARAKQQQELGTRRPHQLVHSLVSPQGVDVELGKVLRGGGVPAQPAATAAGVGTGDQSKGLRVGAGWPADPAVGAAMAGPMGAHQLWSDRQALGRSGGGRWGRRRRALALGRVAGHLREGGTTTGSTSTCSVVGEEGGLEEGT